MYKLVRCVGVFLLLVPVAIPQTTVPVSGSCVVTYNSDGSANLVCTTSLVVPAATATVTVSPSSASVQVGAQVQFTASVTGTGNQAVTWSATAGTISNAGLLTAPNSSGSVTVTATSVAYPAVYGSAAVTVTSGGATGGGGGGSAPSFTGNYCTGTASCTLTSVAAGDMLIIGTHQANPPTSLSAPEAITDTQSETAVFDAINLGAGLQTWHISPVVHAGTHTITVNNFGGGNIYVAEFTGVANGNPIEGIAQNFDASSSTDSVNITTQTANDLLFGFGRSAPGGTQQGSGFTAIRTTPTMEYAAATTVGTQTVSIQPLNNPGTSVGIQALAIRPAGSNPPPPSSPTFTGNFCVQTNGSCTLSNVAAGDMVVISANWHGSPTDTCFVSDSAGESIVVDRQNDNAATIYGSLSLATWHIPNVVKSGTHVISVNGGGGSCWNGYVIQAFEFANQNGSNPIDAVGYAVGTASSTAATSVVTSEGGDLIYAFCAVTDQETSQTGDGFASITVFPTSEYRAASSTPGTEGAACPTTGNWVIQELAIKH
jgi:hypothetical protein